MYIIAGFCDMHWALSWILPFLLGLALGWWIWSRFKKQVEDLKGEIKGYKSTISDLETTLATCKSKRADLEGDLALAKGKMREIENQNVQLLKDIKKHESGGATSKSKGTTKLASETKNKPAGNDHAGNDGVGHDSTGNDKSGSKGSDKQDLSDTGVAMAGGLVSNLQGGSSGQGNDSSLSSSAANKKTMGYAGLKNDNLQIIEGIGPKMEAVLKENGIGTWATLASKNTDDIKAILNNYGDKYRIIDPASWSKQAQLAANGEWDALSALQKDLDGGKATGNTNSAAKVDKVLVRLGLRRKYVQDDLKVVEGIGPKIEGLLHDAGIKTWKQLSEASTEHIQSILNDAGPRYKLADPGTWPKQAAMAHDGDWDKLEEYQDFLQGGK